MYLCSFCFVDKPRLFGQVVAFVCFVFLLNLFFCSSVYADGEDVASPLVESISIFEYGMYRISPKSLPVRVIAGGVTNQVQPISEAKLLIATNRVLAVKGTCFGVRFQVLGQTTNVLAGIVVVVRHPPFTNAPSDTRSIEELIPWLYKTGENAGYMYSLDEEWECVPGDWSIELYHNGIKYAEQCFVLELPENKTNKGSSSKNGAG